MRFGEDELFDEWLRWKVQGCRMLHDGDRLAFTCDEWAAWEVCEAAYARTGEKTEEKENADA